MLEMKTNNEIINHPNWLSTLTYENVTVHLVYNGNPVQIFLFWNDELIINHDNYDPRFSNNKASLEVMVDVISWLTIQESDGCSLFDEYNDKQKDWSMSNECMELRLLASDFENSDEYQNNAMVELNSGFYHC